MKKFRYIWVITAAAVVFLFAAANLWLYIWETQDNGRPYRVELSRVYRQLEKTGAEIELEGLRYVKKITSLSGDASIQKKEDFFAKSNLDHAIWLLDGVYYRVEYETDTTGNAGQLAVIMNGSLSLMALMVFVLIWYLRKYLVKPFYKISDIPYELSKGNLTAGMEEHKSRFFGRFVWGLNLLRENLETERKKELTFQKEKKTLVLSISHDIKTPLSAIKLYAKALERKLYDTEEKQKEIAENINKKADEIENFVAEIIKASNEDFLNLEVKNEEFYLNTLVEEIQSYYQGKLELLRIEFSCTRYQNCLIKGDLDRAVEVLQNLMENAIKYGKGSPIVLELSEEEDCRLATVRNGNCTLSQEEMPHIFQSFWRGANIGNNSGSGLGLYICRQLMMKMDGDIYAEQKDGEIRVTAVFRMI